MENNIPHYFADLVTNVSHANGVFRITFSQQGADRSAKPVMELMVPGGQLGSMLQGINQAANDIADQMRGTADQGDATQAAEKAKPAAKGKKAAEKKS